ncbi:hypothetical protein [Tritonibacter scottomollicae]|uniref:Uncharacterized protein n=1 Tax=Tritonibacter scottomollicae TaxID=483013 RepID=A0A2T1AHE0_TRISK|nr:hypothetical protein [Tritonibacter scottomollicae]PRZ48001.1 hypothetical protein CLV89_105226 [Tritonibacter scottomollicae]
MKGSDLLSAFAVTVAGGLAVYLIRRHMEGDPVSVSIGGLIPSAEEEAEAEGEVYA